MKSTNVILIKVEEKWKNKIEGSDLYIDVNTTDGDYVNAFGIARVVPDTIRTKRPLLVPKSSTSYARLASKEQWLECDIKPDVRQGDLVYFNYYVTFEKEPYFIDGEYLYELSYRNVICTVRDGEVIMIGSHVLIEPMDDTSVKSDLLIIPETAKEEVSDRGFLRHIGESLNGALKSDVDPGDEVVFDKRFAAKYTIEGKEYWVCYQQDLMIKL